MPSVRIERTTYRLGRLPVLRGTNAGRTMDDVIGSRFMKRWVRWGRAKATIREPEAGAIATKAIAATGG